MQRRVGQTLTEQFSQALDRARPIVERYIHDGLGVEDIWVKLRLDHHINIDRATVKSLMMRRA